MIITRFHDFETIDLEVEFLTPAFLGGADQNAELRSAPFKYGLRYWWRVLYGSGYQQFCELKSAEDKIFGSTDLGSAVRIEVTGRIDKTPKTGFQKGDKITVVSKGKEMKVNILDYLAYGHYEYVRGEGNVYLHTHIEAGQKCHLKITAPKNIRNEIIGAVKAFIMYGGIGSRSRNGFGSMSSTSINELKWKSNLSSNVDPMEFPVLNKDTKFLIAKNGHDSWEKALSEVGIAYKSARSSLESRHTFERRGLIARPIEVRNENISDNIRRGRHPKPFYLGVQKRDGRYYGQIFSLPIKFYENNERVRYKEAVAAMHLSLSQTLNDETAKILLRMEVK